MATTLTMQNNVGTVIEQVVNHIDHIPQLVPSVRIIPKIDMYKIIAAVDKEFTRQYKRTLYQVEVKTEDGTKMVNDNVKRGWAPADAKWTYECGQHGYSVIPNILFWYTAQLDIKPAEQALLFQLASRWWEGEGTPTVSKARLAEGLGVSERQVQRYLSSLKKKGLIEARFPNRPGRHPNEYTFNGLVEKLQKIAVAHRADRVQTQYKRSKAVRSAFNSGS